MEGSNPEGTPAPSRRGVLAGVGGLLGGAVGRARSQPATAAQSSQPQITRKAVIPEVGEPFAGNYVGQFLLVTDPTPRTDASPDVVADCAFSTWAPEETRTVEALLVDRLTDDPTSVLVQTFLDGTLPRVASGTQFIVNRVHRCPGDHRGLELEQVPVRTFAPEYGTISHPLVGESPGPTVEQGGDDGDMIGSPGQPGFGALVALLGVGAAAALRRRFDRP